MISIAIVGSGRLAFQLFGVLGALKGYEVSLVLGRNEPALEIFKDTQTSTDFKAPIKEQLVFITVSDNAIAEVSSRINIPNGIVCHMSGSVSIEVLKHHANRGVFYPLQTFGASEIMSFKEIPLLIEGVNESVFQTLFSLASEVSNRTLAMNSSKRRSLHLAAVWVNNFSNFLYTQAAEFCKNQEVPFELLGPLMEQTVKNALTIGPEVAQTGPARRGDTNTMNAHMESLPTEDQKKIYQYISEAIQEKYKHEL
jgi:predicted short-subunit dehydrogenase-like oxidoreductase (DUF2520 family)